VYEYRQYVPPQGTQTPFFPGDSFPFPGGNLGRQIERPERQVNQLEREVRRLEQRLSRIERRLGISY